MFAFPNKLYPITDSQLSNLSVAEQIVQFSLGGARIVQIREKRSSPEEFFQSARAGIVAGHSRGLKVIINDRVDIALAAGADGVHLGQDDLPPDVARKLLGPAAIIGFSTHNVQQAMNAASLDISYIAVGPIFSTGTKANADAVVGLEILRQIRRLVPSLPITAIGGISAENVRSVIAAGADAAAMISALYRPNNQISENTRQILGIFR